MAQSLSKLYIHLVFHVSQSSQTLILSEDKTHLYSYMGTIIKELESHPVLINGTDDHVHILCVLSKNISLALFVKEIKRHSSRWIKSKNDYYRNFAWQKGYGGFSVSPSLYMKTMNYIEKQEEHYKKRTYKEEYLLFLKEYNIDFDEKYLWED